MTPFSSLNSQIRTASRRARLGVVVGGFDISLNEHQENWFEPHWQPHAWIFVPKKQVNRKKREFKSRFRKFRDRVLKPILVKNWDGDLAAIAYCIKGDFQRRVTIPASVSQNTTEKRRRNVRNRPLRASQSVELLLMLDSIGLLARLYLCRAKLVEVSNGVAIKMIRNS